MWSELTCFLYFTSQLAGVDWEYNGYGSDLYPEWPLDTSNAREAMDHMGLKTQVCRGKETGTEGGWSPWHMPDRRSCAWTHEVVA